ncbi:MAG: hypothetical protein ISP82_06670 [Candidatus Poseidoniaceae archaeon]|nr:hypothetical protein [Candidatus Poseidoniaceae archaeon]MBL6896015.1 hypothetical protein [Candidatus Poseidoniaceae archaeon]
MAKRLTKALRGKRRWFGIKVGSQYTTRKQLSDQLNSLASDLKLSKQIRLMDFQLSSEGECSLAIIEVKLLDYDLLREKIDNDESIDTFGVQSVTASGKIRLVRDRLNLTKQ